MNKNVIFSYAWKNFTERFFSKKTFILALILFFSEHLFIIGVGEFCVAVQHKITPYIFPFLISYIYFQLIYTMVVLYYFADVPFMQYRGMYQVIRMGRVKWVLGHVGYIFLSSLGLSLLLVLESIVILFPQIEWSGEWGKILHTLALTDAGSQYDVYPIPFSEEVMRQYTPLQGMLLAIIVCTLVTAFLGMVMFVVSLWSSRVTAIGAASMFLCLPIFTKDVDDMFKYPISCISPVSWLQITEYGSEKYGIRQMPEVNYIMCGLVVLFVVLTVLIVWKIKKTEFRWSHEE